MGGVAQRAALHRRHPAPLTVSQRRMGLVLSQPARDLLPHDSIQLAGGPLPGLMPVALAGAIAAPLAVLFWLCGSVSFFAAFAAMVLTTLVVLPIGCALLRALGAPNRSSWPASHGPSTTTLRTCCLQPSHNRSISPGCRSQLLSGCRSDSSPCARALTSSERRSPARRVAWAQSRR